jgi:hypothetical protein
VQWDYSATASSRPVAAAARAIPDLAALIFSAYFSGIRVDFHYSSSAGLFVLLHSPGTGELEA